MTRWFYAAGGKCYGPVDSATLKHLSLSGFLRAEDRVRREDMSQWIRADQVKGLCSSQPKHGDFNNAEQQADSDSVQYSTVPSELSPPASQMPRRQRIGRNLLFGGCAAGVLLFGIKILINRPRISHSASPSQTVDLTSLPASPEKKVQTSVVGSTHQETEMDEKNDENKAAKKIADDLPLEITEEVVRKWAIKYGWLAALNWRDFPDEPARQRHFSLLIQGAMADLKNMPNGQSAAAWDDFFRSMHRFLAEQTIENEKQRQAEGRAFFRQLERMQAK